MSLYKATQKVIPIEQGLKPDYQPRRGSTGPTQKVIPIEQGLKPGNERFDAEASDDSEGHSNRTRIETQ